MGAGDPERHAFGLRYLRVRSQQQPHRPLLPQTQRADAVAVCAGGQRDGNRWVGHRARSAARATWRRRAQPQLHGLLRRQQRVGGVLRLLQHPEHPRRQHRAGPRALRGRLPRHRALHGRWTKPRAVLHPARRARHLPGRVPRRVHRHHGQHQDALLLLRLHRGDARLHRRRRRAAAEPPGRRGGGGADGEHHPRVVDAALGERRHRHHVRHQRDVSAPV